jgi:hypothetical protein
MESSSISQSCTYRFDGFLETKNLQEEIVAEHRSKCDISINGLHLKLAKEKVKTQQDETSTVNVEKHHTTPTKTFPFTAYRFQTLGVDDDLGGAIKGAEVGIKVFLLLTRAALGWSPQFYGVDGHLQVEDAGREGTGHK